VRSLRRAAIPFHAEYPRGNPGQFLTRRATAPRYAGAMPADGDPGAKRLADAPASAGGAPATPADPDPVATIYAQLQAIAQHQMRGERAGHTLTATALVHEAYLRLEKAGLGDAADRGRFYHAAAEAMRRVLIEHARRRGALKRGGGRRREHDIENVLDLSRDDHIDNALALDEALLRLEEEDPEAAGVVRLRFYAGLTGDGTAAVLGMSPRQVDRAWAFARAFLLRELRRADGEGEAEPGNGRGADGAGHLR
jgi:RNA polymerase sigma factor (TIGR02999 family)